MVQKKTGSGISTPANKSLSASLFCPCFFSPSLPARRAAANALDLDETMVSPVAVCKQIGCSGIKQAVSEHSTVLERQIHKAHYNFAQIKII